MRWIRSARAAGVSSDADAAALAQTIDDAIGHMIRHCRLPADADAYLHGLLGELGNASVALRRGGAPAAALAAIDDALERYAQRFAETDPAAR